MYKKLYGIMSLVLAAGLFTGCSNGSLSKGVEYVTESEDSAKSTDGISIETVEKTEETVEETANEASSSSSSSSDAATTETSVSGEEAVAKENENSSDDRIQVVFLGDSQFANGRDEGTDIATYTGWMTGANVYNLGVGGSCASITTGDSYDEGYVTNAFINIVNVLAGNASVDTISNEYVHEHISDIDVENVDYYVIEYGYNDYMSKHPQADELAAYDVHLYVDALRNGIDILKEISPDAKIILCCPSYCLVYDVNGQYLGDSNMTDLGYGTLSDYVDSCKALAEGLGLIYIDAYYGSEFDLNAYTIDDYTIDGLHFDQKGRYIYATVVSHYINKDLGVDTEELDTIIFNRFEYNG
ncbi:MAG: SGNH/GDSL hydrolase family protein [Butyrivibrio sp.]|nr:SGNH/GDSL hydrolase family protein [Butyrivibrio sp.]